MGTTYEGSGAAQPDFSGDFAATNPQAFLATLDSDKATELQQVFAQYDPDTLRAETGLSLIDLAQTVSIETESGVKTGSLAAMIAEPRCPAGQMVRSRYTKKGIDGVTALFEDWKDDVPGFKAVISPHTLAREAQKKTLQAWPVKQ